MGIWNQLFIPWIHWRRVKHICVRKQGHHWFRQCLVACSTPSHFPNQGWLIVNLILGNIIQWHSKKMCLKMSPENGGHFVQVSMWPRLACIFPLYYLYLIDMLELNTKHRELNTHWIKQSQMFPTSLFDSIPNNFWKRSIFFLRMLLLLQSLKGKLCENSNGAFHNETIQMYWVDDKKHPTEYFHLIWFCVPVSCLRTWRRDKQCTFDKQ